MKKPKIIVYHNTIQDKKVFIVVFKRQPMDFDGARYVLSTYSDLTYSAIPIGKNAVTYIEKTDKEIRQLLTMEEYTIGKLMLMSIPNKKGKLRDKSFEDVMKIYHIEKAVMFEVKD